MTKPTVTKQLISTQLVYDENFNPNLITIEKIKDQVTGKIKKKASFDSDPKITYFITKPEHELTYPVKVIERDKLTPITTSYKDLFKSIAKARKRMNEYNEAKNTRKRGKFRFLHNDCNVYGSDVDLADYAMMEWEKNTPPDVQDASLPLEKVFSDIEVDIYNYEGFPVEELAPCEINFVSYVNPNRASLVKVWVLFNEENHSMAEFIDNYADGSALLSSDDNEYAKYVLDDFINNNDTEKLKFHKFKTLEIEFFDDELELIKSYMTQVKKDKPDFNALWNAHFDIRTFYERILKLGGDPVEIFCPENFPVKKCEIRKDERAKDVADRSHTFDISGYTHWVDLLYFYAANRKAKGQKESWKLQDILLSELGEGKFEYEGDIKTAAYVNFESFLKYSIYDSYRMYQLETKCRDIDVMYANSLMTCTRLNKVLKKTTSIKNIAKVFLEKEGYILSNNLNIFIEREKKKFQGAFVLDPTMMQKVGTFINGRRTANIFEDTIDEDLSSMYPSIILAYGIDNETLLGKFLVFLDEEEETIDPLFDSFGEKMMEDDPEIIATTYFNLKPAAYYLERLDDFIEK